jgi:Ca2+-transporting ATPase
MPYYQKSKDQLFQKFNVTDKGLTQKEASQRLKAAGLNELITSLKVNKLSLFLSQFKSFIIYILLFAVVLSVVAGDTIEAIIISAILIFNAFIGFFQEYSAQKSLEALKKFNYVRVKVYRDSTQIIVDSKNLVPGDIISLEAGDKVPADCRILQSTQLKLQEAVLTGESVAVSKDEDLITTEVQLGDQKNMLFSSTIVVEGVTKALVVETGMQTEIGKITQLLRETKEELTPLQKKLNAFGKNLGFSIIAVCLLIIVSLSLSQYFIDGFNFQLFRDIVLISVALAVAAIPEGLPAVVTITLSIGVKRLLKKKTLVRRLAAVETLGSCNVICTDKTGTLTKNEMTVQQAWCFDGQANLSGLGYDPTGSVSLQLNPLLFEIGLVCNDAAIYQKQGDWKISGDPTEAALLVSAAKAGVKSSLNRIAELTFNSTRKKMSVLIKKEDSLYTYTKGAPDQVLKDCSHILINNKVEAITADTRQQIMAQVDHYSSQALRVLAFAYKPTASNKDFTEEQLVFVGLQAMLDPPRKDVLQSIQKTKQAGIRVIMITGDYLQTAKAIGDKIGIQGSCITGAELEQMSETQIQQALVKNTNIFARTIPEHKQKIISALQNLGLIVAMTGDGVNDAPALKKADIGIAVNSGTDVAKEASDFILLDDSFTHIVNAIEEGRGIYDNIQKTIMFLLSGNLSEVLIVLLAIILGWSLPMTAIMILWINLISDGAPALTLAMDPYGNNIMQKRPKNVTEGILPKRQLLYILTVGTLSSIIILLFFNYYQQVSLIKAQTIVFNAIVFAEIGLLFAIRNLFNTSQTTNKWLWITLILSIAVQVIIVYSPLSKLFGVTLMNAKEWLLMLGIGIITYIAGVLITKLMRRFITEESTTLNP